MQDRSTMTALLVAPLAEQIDPDRFARETLRKEPTAQDKATIAIWGHCAEFCGSIYGDTKGATLEDHGPFCESRMLLWAEGARVDGTPVRLCGEVVKPYHHGVYDKADMPLRSESLFAVSTSDAGDQDRTHDYTRDLFITSGELRRMAAAFVRAADVMDGLDPLPSRRSTS